MKIDNNSKIENNEVEKYRKIFNEILEEEKKKGEIFIDIDKDNFNLYKIVRLITEEEFGIKYTKNTLTLQSIVDNARIVINFRSRLISTTTLRYKNDVENISLAYKWILDEDYIVFNSC